MAPRTEKFAYRVELDGKSAAEALETLKEKSKGLKDQMKALKEANDLAGFEKVERDVKSVEREMKRYQLAVFDVQKVMNNLSGVTTRDLITSQRVLTRQLKDELVPGTKEYEAAMKQLALVQKQVKENNAAIRNAGASGDGIGSKTTNFFSKIADGVNKYALMLGGAIFGLSALKNKADEAVDSFNKFEQSKANLQSLTGVTKELRDEMGAFALKLSTDIVDGGVRITQSATDIVDGFKLVGSQLPMLLKDSEALKQVTKDALILSEASGGPVQDNVKGLTTTMNQFNLVTSDTNETIKQSHRVINILAAGAQAGAGEIPYIQEAMEKAGTQANMFNISVENTVGIIETLAPRISEASKAGTGLRGVLIQLETQTNDNFKPSIVGYSKAMDNLAAANLNATQLQKLFGMEQFTAGKILIDYRKETEAYTKDVTNSNKAIEQATINTDTNTAKLAQATNVAEKQRIELGEKLAPVVLIYNQGVNVLTRSLIKFVDIFSASQTKLEKATAIFEKQSNEVEKLDKNLQPLLAKYDELMFKGDRTKKQQDELNNVIKQISVIMPEAVSSFDDLGGAMEINTGKARDLIEHMRRVKAVLNEDVIKEREKERNATMVDQIGIGRSIQRLKAQLPGMEQEAENLKGTKYYDDQIANIKTQRVQIKNLNDQWYSLNEKVKNYNELIKELKGENIPSIIDPTNTKTDANTNGSSTIVGEDKSAQKAIKDLEDAQTRLKEINLSLELARRDGLDKEVFSIYQKYQKEIEIAAANENTKTELGKKWGAQRKALELARAEETAAAIAKFELDAEKKQQDEIDKEAEKRKQKHDSILSKYGIDKQQTELQQLQDFLAKKIISEEEFEKAKAVLQDKYRLEQEQKNHKAYLDRIHKYDEEIQTQMAITNAFASFFDSAKQLELQKAGENEEKKKAIAKKYADIDFAITASKITSATALAIVKALELGPIAGPIAAGFIGAAGALELGVANKERTRVKGFESGYYGVTRTDGMQFRAGISTDTGTQMVSNPTVFIAGEKGAGFPEMIIDGTTMRNLQINYPEAVDAIHKSRNLAAYAGGGTGAPGTTQNKEVIKEVKDTQTLAVLNKLAKRLDEGISATLVYRDFKKFLDKVDQAKTDFN